MTSTTILITGANTGLGFETVKALLQSPTAYNIILSGRSIEKVEAAAKEARTEFPTTTSVIKTLQLDIEDDDSITKAFDFVEKEIGVLDVLINNAGLSSLLLLSLP